MKKFSFFKIASLALVCVMLLGAFMFTTFANDESADETVEIVSQNVYFDDKLELMFAVNAPAGHSVTATVNGEEVDVVLYLTNPTDDNDVKVADYAYKLVQGVVPQAIDTVVTFTVTYGETTVSKNYSVLQYLYERINVSDNRAEGEELVMFEALLAYADAANAYLNEEPTVSFSDYKYVTVDKGTLDGYNTAGMFLPGATPFENIAANIVLEEGQGIEWSVSVNGGEAVVKSFDEVKALEITGNTVVTAKAVAATCEHVWVGATCTEAATCQLCGVTGEANGHAWQNNATCTTAETCANCDATGTPALGHTTPNAEGKCDRCSVSLLKSATLSYTGSTTGNMTGNNDAATLGLDASIFTVIGNKGSTSNNCGLNKSGQIRLYGDKTSGNGSYFTVTVAEGYTIKSINITIGGTNGGFKVTAGDTVLAENETSKNTSVTYDVNGEEFKLQNVVTGATTQVYILSIEITYVAE